MAVRRGRRRRPARGPTSRTQALSLSLCRLAYATWVLALVPCFAGHMSNGSVFRSARAPSVFLVVSVAYSFVTFVAFVVDNLMAFESSHHDPYGSQIVVRFDKKVCQLPGAP